MQTATQTTTRTVSHWINGENAAPGPNSRFADVTNPDRRATHCWCLSHRLVRRASSTLGTRDEFYAASRTSAGAGEEAHGDPSRGAGACVRRKTACRGARLGR